MKPKRKILITGVSSGIGRVLAKKQIALGNIVWGVARRRDLLEDLSKEIRTKNFHYTVLDLSKNHSWEILISKMKIKKFIPDVIVFNAAIYQNDLYDNIDTNLTRKIFETNFFSVLNGINHLIKFTKKDSQFILISSSSALKGNNLEGIGYGASKAAISLAFETLYQKYKDRFIFKTIYFGPVDTGMSPFMSRRFLFVSKDKAADFIHTAIGAEKIFYEKPKIIFLTLKFIKLFPNNLYFKILSIFKSNYKNSKDV